MRNRIPRTVVLFFSLFFLSGVEVGEEGLGWREAWFLKAQEEEEEEEEAEEAERGKLLVV